MSAVIVIAVTTTAAPSTASPGDRATPNDDAGQLAAELRRRTPGRARGPRRSRPPRAGPAAPRPAPAPPRAPARRSRRTPARVDVRARQVAGGDADARAGAPGGDRRRVHDRRRQPGLRVAQHDQAVGDRQAPGGVLRVERDPLGAEAAVTRQRRRHDLRVGVALAVQAELGRHDDLSPALGGAAAVHGVDDLEHGHPERLEVVAGQVEQRPAGGRMAREATAASARRRPGALAVTPAARSRRRDAGQRRRRRARPRARPARAPSPPRRRSW